MYDYPTRSGLGVMAGERRVPQNPDLNVQLPVAPLVSPVTTGSTSTSTPPAASQVVTGTPGASAGTVVSTAPVTSTDTDQITVAGWTVDFANPVTWVFLGAAILAVSIPKSTEVKVGLLAAVAFAYYEAGTISF
jgi:hypothetical protein